MSEPGMERNEANADLQAVLASDPGFSRVHFPADGRGLRVGNDWLIGKVRITGPISLGRAALDEMREGKDLVVLEDGPGGRRLSCRRR